MNTKIFLVLPAIIIVVGLFIISFQPNTQSAVGSGTMVMDSNIPAQEPPGFSPSRNKEGGPAGRRSWETMRLANPATGRIPPDIHRREQEFARRLPSRGSSALMEAAGLDPGAKMGGWGFRGPDNIGGRTRALAIDVSDPGYQTLLAGGVSGGMWRSVDDGNSWELTTGSSQLHSVTTLAQDTRPGHENVWYYGTGEANWNSASHYNAYYAGDGVFKSTDNGQTWALLPSTSGFPPSNFYSFWQYVWRVAVDPSNQVEDEIYAAIFGKIMRSVDGGATFDQVLGDTSSPYSPYTDVVVSSTGVVYASISSEGSTTGIFRSPDGINWTNITPTNLTTHSRIVLAVAPSNEIILYATVANVYGSINEGLFRYIYVSGDGSGTGGFWEDRSLALGLMPLPSGGTGPMEYYGGYSMQLTVNPTNPNNLYLGGVHLYRDIGAGYQRIGGAEYPVHHADLHLLVFQPGSSSIAYSGSDGGVHKTLDIDGPSVDWVSLNNSYNTSQFYTVAIDENLEGSDIIVGGMQDNGTCITTTQDPADPWLETLSGDGSYCAVADASGAVGTYLQSFQNGYLYRVEVDNTTGARTFWGQITPTDAGDYLFINPFIIDPNDTKIVYLATSNGVWRNNDLYNTPAGSPTMTNWDHLTTEPAGDHVTALAMSRSANRVLYYGTLGGRVFRLDNADSALPGSTPVELDMGQYFTPGSCIANFAVHPHDDQKVLLGITNYEVVSLFYTEDGGVTWTPQEGNLGGSYGPSIRDVAIVPFGEATIYLVATSTGLYSSFYLVGASTHWSLEAPDLMGNVVVDQIATRQIEEECLVVAATHGKGVYSNLVPVGTAVDDSPTPQGVSLAQNVPNPFNPMTSISFSLPGPGHASLVIYDVAGRQVKALVNQDFDAGDHQVTWQGDDDTGHQVAAGVYLYKLDSGSVHEVKRMTLVR